MMAISNSQAQQTPNSCEAWHLCAGRRVSKRKVSRIQSHAVAKLRFTRCCGSLSDIFKKLQALQFTKQQNTSENLRLQDELAGLTLHEMPARSDN